MDVFTSYAAGRHPGRTGTSRATQAIDAFGSYSADYGLQHIEALAGGERSRLDGPALAALTLILAGLPALTLALEKLA